MTHERRHPGRQRLHRRRARPPDRHPSRHAHRGAHRRPQGGADDGAGLPAPAPPRPADALAPSSEVDFGAVDLAFCALPHGPSQALIRDLPRDLKVVDLGADFRLRDPAAYAEWYGKEHVAPELQAEAVYGLTEFYRDEIRAARLVAGTGCNAATGSVRAAPADRGAGSSTSTTSSATSRTASRAPAARSRRTCSSPSGARTCAATRPGGTHRHLGEFDQEFSARRRARGADRLHAAPDPGQPRHPRHRLRQGRRRRRCTRRWPPATPTSRSGRPALRRAARDGAVQGSNFVHLGVVGDRVAGRALVVSTLDNLNKGSSGQAIQNANLMLGLRGDRRG